MGKFFSAGATAGLLFVSIACAAPARIPPGTVAQALVRQARQYTHIKTIHFLAVGRYTVMTAQGKTKVAKIRYEYWGDGIKYRIDFQQFIPGANIDVVVTDNGKHFRLFYRNSGSLIIAPTHPIYGSPPVTQNPILEPLVPLATSVPPHLGTPRKTWVNLARIARNPKSVFDRCRLVRNCGKALLGGEPVGCIMGAYNTIPANVTFTIGRHAPHLVVRWQANQHGFRGAYICLSRITYRSFPLPSGEKLYLPVRFEETGMTGHLPGPWRGPFSNQVIISHISLDKPVAASKFTISYKLARSIQEVMPDGKSHQCSVRSFSPAPGHDWSLMASWRLVSGWVLACAVIVIACGALLFFLYKRMRRG